MSTDQILHATQALKSTKRALTCAKSALEIATRDAEQAHASYNTGLLNIAVMGARNQSIENPPDLIAWLGRNLATGSPKREYHDGIMHALRVGVDALSRELDQRAADLEFAQRKELAVDVVNG